MDFLSHTRLAADNYQKLAAILLSQDTAASKVEQLLSVQMSPVPDIKRPGYAIWSAGMVAEVFVCFPDCAFSGLVGSLETTAKPVDNPVLFKALSMWGDAFAEALVKWLDGSSHEMCLQALNGVALYAKQLEMFCAEDRTPEMALQAEDYPESVWLKREQEIGVPPAARLRGTQREALMALLAEQLSRDTAPPEQIAVLRGLSGLYQPGVQHGWLQNTVQEIAAIAEKTPSRTLEREAVLALCRLDPVFATEQMQQHWMGDTQRRLMAAEVLGLLRSESAFEMLRDMVSDENPETRRKAISSLEAFGAARALSVLQSLEDTDKKVQRQILRTRSALTWRVRHRKQPSSLYAISPLTLLRQTPMQPVFTEQELNSQIEPALLSDVSSSRRYAVELGLLERRGDVYRLSRYGTVIHWVEGFLREGLTKFAESAQEG